MARCPVCDVEMKEVSARANPGTLIVLDQCRKCGGIWCDKWELFPIVPEEAGRLDPVDETLLQQPIDFPQKTLYCPRCRDRLQVLRDPLLPAEIQLQRCRRCEGIWLNRGQFGRYKRLQKKTRTERLAPEETIRKVVKVAPDPNAWVTTGTRGIFAYPHAEEEPDLSAKATLRGAFSLILRALLRMVLPF
ncbi:MAG: zf-TFIIB domain-containing protein [Deltaproteobacteria bacterium]|nr:zf-TFIIB domain-containing protein [Deltaproteobacteria bacterium]